MFKPEGCLYGPPPVENEREEAKLWALPQFGMDAGSELAKGRTDLYLLGLPGSGKSSLLASVLGYMSKEDILRYVPQANDGCRTYYQGLVDGLAEGKFPQATRSDTLVPMQFNIGTRYRRPMTVIEYGGKAFKELSQANISGQEVWTSLSLGRCIKNSNPKSLFFLFDYSSIIGKNPRFSAADQEEILGNALDVFVSDGAGRYGDKNCTMSKVKTIAVVITKSDLMDDEMGYPLTRDERDGIAFRYLQDRLSSFMNNLSDICNQYCINENIEEHACEIWVSAFSLGRVSTENMVEVEDTDARRLADFIVKSTPKRGLFGLK